VELSLAPGYVDIGAYEFQGSSNDITPPGITGITPAGVGMSGFVAPLDRIVLRFSEKIDGINAIAAANYQLVSPGPDNLYDTADDVAHVLAPSYNGLLDVTLTVADGLLPAGPYRLTVYGAPGRSIRDVSGLRLDGDDNGTEGGNYVSCFAVTWQGDANCDGVVDAADYITVKRNFGSAGGSTWEKGDFTGDGKTNYADLLLLMANMGKSVSVVEAAPVGGDSAAAGQGAETGQVVDINAAADATDAAQPEAADSDAKQAAVVEPPALLQQTARPASEISAMTGGESEIVTVPTVAVAEPEPSASPVDGTAAANVTMAELSVDLPAASSTLQATAGILDALAHSKLPRLSTTPSIARPSYAERPTRFASRVGPLSISTSALLRADNAGLLFADVLQLAVPWWSGDSARHELPDEPLMTTLSIDITGKPRKGRLDPIGLDVLAART
jgi:hypothetical protein